MSTIPASAVVQVNPSVLGAGGQQLDLNGLFLTENTRVPIGTVMSFASVAAVSAFFGASSPKVQTAALYFGGYVGALVTPGAMLFAQYPIVPVSAYLRGGNVGTLTLTQLQALNALLGVTIDGSLKTATIALSAATSFSNAASIIGNGLAIQGPQVSQFTGSIGASGTASTTLNVTAMISGTIGIGDVVGGTGITAGTYILSQLTGTVGGVGTYQVSISQLNNSGTVNAFAPGVVFDSISNSFNIVSASVGSGSTITFGSGALATSLSLTQVTGSVLSQGALASTPIAFMNSLVLSVQNWATFTTLFNPDASGNANKLLFAQWTSQQNNRYAYISTDTDVSPATSVPAPASLGAFIAAAGYAGTTLIYDPSINAYGAVAAFICGAVASIDFEAPNQRITLAFRSTAAGLIATVTDQQTSANLIANGYNFYGAYATANSSFIFFYPGSVSGTFLWLDSFVNQIWMNNQFQLALMNLLTTLGSVPYNSTGSALIEAALSGPINAALSFGAFRPGVVLSATQAAAVNAAVAGSGNVAQTLSTRGWFLFVGVASPQVRAARGTPPCIFWYTDGESIQQITLASVDIL